LTFAFPLVSEVKPLFAPNAPEPVLYCTQVEEPEEEPPVTAVPFTYRPVALMVPVPFAPPVAPFV
jgi:hypothetical protein